jgi:hypothetical protein
VKHSDLMAAKIGALSGELKALDMTSKVYSEYNEKELLLARYKAALTECLAILNGDYDDKYEVMIREVKGQ